MSKMSIDMETVVQRKADLLVQPLDDDLVMADLTSGNYYGLGASGRAIWEMIEQPARVADICASLRTRYDVAPETCEAEVLDFLRDLEGQNLIRVAA